MKLIKKLLTSTHGYTLIEVLLSITIFAIGIVPVYQIIISGAKVQNVAEETYEATLHSQALLQDLKVQMEEDLGEEYKQSRGSVAKEIKPWLAGGKMDLSLLGFLEIEGQDKDTFSEKYALKDYLYEVYIWPVEQGQAKIDQPISLIAPAASGELGGKEARPSDLTNIEIGQEEINQAIKTYFSSNQSLVWEEYGSEKPISIGEIVYNSPEKIEIINKGQNAINIAGHYHKNDDTYEVIISGHANNSNIIQLAVDLTSFPSEKERVIRIENQTQATVLVPIYNENFNSSVKIYPIQEAEAGTIILEDRPKLEPIKNYLIGIIVKDANNIAFGDSNKILSKIVDVYSFDYNKQ